MSIDNEIMQEFLVEAGELYEQLNDQFVQLESSPDDADLVNAIFRAYHTIKGGAGFMKLTPMVEVCHRAEDAINLVRQGEKQVDPQLVDVMFQVLDALEVMFDDVRAGNELSEADPGLIQQLDALLGKGDTPSQETAAEAPQQPPTVTPEAPSQPEAVSEVDSEFDQMLAAADTGTAASTGDLITDDEFENLMDELHGEGKGPGSSAPADTPKTDPDLITDDEFEKMMDDLHGKGKGPGSNEVKEAPKSDPDLITDDEFEKMMDEMHGKGKGPGSAAPVKQETPAEVIEHPASKQETQKKPAAAKTAAPQAESTVRVDTARLDNIMNLVGELVLVRNRLSMLKYTTDNTNMADAISTLELVTSELQSSVMKTRMQPIKKVFSRFPRQIRDLARKLNKEINLELIGEETDLDKSLVEALADPLIHLVRNSADHGIESPQDRFEAGKPRTGTVTLSAQQEGDQILITVQDDGKGMDHKVFRRKAVEKGMMSEDAAMAMTNKEAYNLIFAPGFSTKDEISDVSGRGVGMDVVKTRITELNGTVEIDSSLGEGSVISIYLPLTLAILPTLMVNLGRYQYALPLTNVLEAFNMEPDRINVVDGQEVIRVRERPLPLFYMQPWLVRDHMFDGPVESQKVIVVQMGNQKFCLVVDSIVGQEEIVIKPLGTMLTEVNGFSGATITSDGSIALILDVPGLMGTYAANSSVY